MSLKLIYSFSDIYFLSQFIFIVQQSPAVAIQPQSFLKEISAEIRVAIFSSSAPWESLKKHELLVVQTTIMGN